MSRCPYCNAAFLSPRQLEAEPNTGHGKVMEFTTYKYFCPSCKNEIDISYTKKMSLVLLAPAFFLGILYKLHIYSPSASVFIVCIVLSYIGALRFYIGVQFKKAASNNSFKADGVPPRP